MIDIQPYKDNLENENKVFVDIDLLFSLFWIIRILFIYFKS